MNDACTERIKWYDMNLIVFTFYLQEFFPVLVPLTGLYMRLAVTYLAHQQIPGRVVKDNALNWALIFWR